MKFYNAKNNNLHQNQFESWLDVLLALLMHNTIIHALLLELNPIRCKKFFHLL